MSKVLGILEISPGLIGFTVYSRVAQTNPGYKSGCHLCRKKFGVLWVRNYDPEMTLCDPWVCLWVAEDGVEVYPGAAQQEERRRAPRV